MSFDNPANLALINDFISVLVLNFALGFYLIAALQWFSYKLSRIIFHFTRFSWHIFFIFLPWFVYIGLDRFFLIYAFVFWLPILWLWHKKLDKKLVFTTKIKAFFAFLGFFTLLFAALGFVYGVRSNLEGLVFALIFLKIFEIWQNHKFTKLAQQKLAQMSDLKIILITASYGKTSIKNFLSQILSSTFSTYHSPRSVNTLLGIVADINQNLSANTQIYIAEAGARQKSDILAITRLLNPQICIIGEIGNAHLEYFKSVENIRSTKLEALQSKRLQKAFCHSSTLQNENKQCVIYDKALKSVNSTLDGLEFELKFKDKNEGFQANLLGSFNGENLSACIMCAEFLGVNLERIRASVASLRGVEHRLQIISKTPKFIIDDGFNGNFKGMSESYLLCKSYAGRRVLVTPGIVEVNAEQNKALCETINSCFDLVIIIGEVNSRTLSENVSVPKIVLKDKATLVQTLATQTKNGDLILFSNDTPSFM